MKQYRITIKGEVQGVFFRAFAQKEAERLRLKGYVKNDEEGNVVVVAQGFEEKLKELIEKCKQGPKGAKVEKVEVKEEDVDSYTHFEIKY